MTTVAAYEEQQARILDEHLNREMGEAARNGKDADARDAQTSLKHLYEARKKGHPWPAMPPQFLVGRFIRRWLLRKVRARIQQISKEICEMRQKMKENQRKIGWGDESRRLRVKAHYATGLMHLSCLLRGKKHIGGWGMAEHNATHHAAEIADEIAGKIVPVLSRDFSLLDPLGAAIRKVKDDIAAIDNQLSNLIETCNDRKAVTELRAMRGKAGEILKHLGTVKASIGGS